LLNCPEDININRKPFIFQTNLLRLARDGKWRNIIDNGNHGNDNAGANLCVRLIMCSPHFRKNGRTCEMAARIKNETGRNITVNAFNPGFMTDTGLGENAKSAGEKIAKCIAPLLARILGTHSSVKKSGRLARDAQPFCGCFSCFCTGAYPA
jgi:NAD(P)-dependent dehydrogenase (short-subunit alcohol dehydrogenase family)